MIGSALPPGVSHDAYPAWLAGGIGPMAAFLTATAACDDQALLRAIRASCTLGHGIWTEPPAQPDPRHSPPTHLYEINLFGHPATGLTPEHAAHNWRRTGLSVLQAHGDHPGPTQ